MTAPHPVLSRPAPPEAPARPGLASTVTDSVLHAYGQVVFARSRVAGAGVLLASFLAPEVGATGLLGVLCCDGIALAIGLDREAVVSGTLGANALLLFLGLGAAGAPWVVVPLAASLLVLAYTAVAGGLRYHLQLPALSLPFVLSSWLLALAAPTLAAHVSGQESGTLGSALGALGMLVFHPTAATGAVLLIAVLAWSRVAAVHAGLGLAVAALAAGGPVDPIAGFNAALVSVALGGVFYVPGPASLALAVIGAGLAAYGTVAATGLLHPLALGALALPLNAVILLVVYALAQRVRVSEPRPVSIPCPTPEATLHLDRTRVRRFHARLPVALQLPFHGAWVCTQGNDGEHTHQGAWRHGLDFEQADTEGRRHRGTGALLEDWLCYREPVCAVAAGTVVAVTDGVPDNPVGELNLADNWGNVVVVQHAPGLFSLVAHLCPGTIRVAVGQVVAAGEVLGLCGNSGRSPAPHLHVQLQASAAVGDPTVAIRFHGAIRGRDALVREGLPRQGETWRNPQDAEGLSDCLAFPVGGRWLLRVRAEDRARVEWVYSEVDLLGRRSLFSPSRKARLWFDHGPRGFVAFDHVGPRDGGLFALYCALARVTWDEAAELSWRDWLAPRRVAGGFVPWLADALGAFWPTSPQAIRYVARWKGCARVITGHAPARRPWQRTVDSEAVLLPGGTVHVRASAGPRTLHVHLEAA